MLIEFKVANYRSIRDEQTLSFLASNYSNELPDNLIPLDLPGFPKGTHLLRAVALYGANASGKSNIIGALRFLSDFVHTSATSLAPVALTGVQPFKMDPAYFDQPSRFEVTAVIKGVRTLYGLELTKDRVTREHLVAYPHGRAQVWFEREWVMGEYVWSRSTEHFRHDVALREKTREDAAFLSVAAQFNHLEAAFVSAWIAGVSKTMRYSGGTLPRIALSNPWIREQLSESMSRADLGIIGIGTRSATSDEKLAETFQHMSRDSRFMQPAAKAQLSENFANTSLRDHLKARLDTLTMEVPAFLHSGLSTQSVPLDFDEEESSGTRRFFELATSILDICLGSRLLVIDEFEASLHPILVRELMGFFLRNSKTSAGAQFLFTTHNSLLLDQTFLRRDQIWFTEKDDGGATRLYPLTDYAPRKEESLIKGYLAGRYGGIPFIPEGLMARADPQPAKVETASPLKPQRVRKRAAGKTSQSVAPAAIA